MKSLKAVIGFTLAFLGLGVVGSASFINKNSYHEARAAYSQGSVIANDKARIWIGYDTSNPFYSYADANTGIRLWIHSTSSGGSEEVYGTITGTFNNSAESNRRYDFFDVDLAHYTNQWYMTVQKFQDGNWKGQTNPIQLKANNAFQVYWVWGDWSWNNTAGTVAAGSIDSVDAGLAAKALAGMHSCSSSSINGYNAFANFNSTFVKNGNDWKTVGNLSDYEITDFANGNTSYTGSPNTTINAYTKYEYVQSMYNGAGSSANNALRILNQSGSTTTIIVIVSLIGITAIGGYLFLKKKEEKVQE